MIDKKLNHDKYLSMLKNMDNKKILTIKFEKSAGFKRVQNYWGYLRLCQIEDNRFGMVYACGFLDGILDTLKTKCIETESYDDLADINFLIDVLYAD